MCVCVCPCPCPCLCLWSVSLFVRRLSLGALKAVPWKRFVRRLECRGITTTTTIITTVTVVIAYHHYYSYCCYYYYRGCVLFAAWRSGNKGKFDSTGRIYLAAYLASYLDTYPPTWIPTYLPTYLIYLRYLIYRSIRQYVCIGDSARACVLHEFAVLYTNLLCYTRICCPRVSRITHT